jgi:DNA-binding MarR family transcriptional regulator
MSLPTVVVLLARLGGLNEALIHEVCRAHDTGPAELRTLAALRHQAATGPVTPTALARWIVQTSGGLTATLKRLEARGFVERSTDPLDRRSRLVGLTAAGADFHDAVFADLVARYDALFGDVDLDAALDAIRSLIGPFEQVLHARPSAGWDVGDLAAVPE